MADITDYWADGSGGGTALSAINLNAREEAVLDASTAYADALRHQILPYSVSGALSVDVGTLRIYMPTAGTLVSVEASIGVAATGASVIVDVHKNGTTVFSTQANRPTITAAGFTSGKKTPNTTSFVTGDYLTVDVDQIGSTLPGQDLTVVIRYLEV